MAKQISKTIASVVHNVVSTDGTIVLRYPVDTSQEGSPRIQGTIFKKEGDSEEHAGSFNTQVGGHTAVDIRPGVDFMAVVSLVLDARDNPLPELS